MQLSIVNGTLNFNITMEDIKKKFNTPEDYFKLYSEFDDYTHNKYFHALYKKHPHFDIENILTTWKKLIYRFPNHKHFELLQETYLKVIENIKKEFKLDKNVY
ncbi:MAG: hypothetical protein ABII27_01940 [bacterium]